MTSNNLLVWEGVTHNSCKTRINALNNAMLRGIVALGSATVLADLYKH